MEGKKITLHLHVEEDMGARGPAGRCSPSLQRDCLSILPKIAPMSISMLTLLYVSTKHLSQPDMLYICLSVHYLFLQNASSPGQHFVWLVQVSPAPYTGLAPEYLFDE